MKLLGYPLLSILIAVLFIYLGFKILKWACWTLAITAIIIGTLMIIF